MLENDLIVRQIKAFTAALLRIKSKVQQEKLDILDDLGELFDELFGLKGSIALALDPAALVRLLSPGGVFDKDRGRVLVSALELQADACAKDGRRTAERRHRAQIEALLCAGDFDGAALAANFAAKVAAYVPPATLVVPQASDSSDSSS